MVFSYRRENRSSKTLIVCSNSHLLLQLSDSSAALEGERENLVLGSSHISKGKMFFFQYLVLKLTFFKYGQKILWYKGKMLIDFPWEFEFHPLPSLVRSPMLRDLKHPNVTQSDFFQSSLTARYLSKITTLYLLVEIYHTCWGFKEADENNNIIKLRFI